MTPKVSVIVPVYNAEKYLPQCIDTILLQTFDDFEAIFVNDGSTDGSLDILQGYAMWDSRMKIIEGEHRGGGAARNKGLAEATGKYVIFLDSDDFFHPEMLEKMVGKAECDNSDIVVSGHMAFDEATQKDVEEIKLDEKYVSMSPLAPLDFKLNLFTFATPAPWNKLVRRECIEKNDICFDEKAHADDILFSCVVLAVAEKISVMEDTFTHYRINVKTQQSKNKPATLSDISQTLSRGWEKLKVLNLDEKFKVAYVYRLKRSLQFELGDRKTEQKREALLSIRTALSAELYNELFNSSRPRISIIIPVYNAASFLQECLDSAINQTLKEIEIICVNDGSTDNSLDILRTYEKQDNRIKVLTQINQRQSIARYNAMKIATGEYIQFLDADDYLDLDTCECLYTYSRLYDLDMLSFSAIEFNQDTRSEFEDAYHCLTWMPENFIPRFTWQNVANILPRIAVTACLTVYRHDFLKCNKIEWLQKKIAYEDSLFFTESILSNGVMGVLSEKFYHRRVHGSSTTQNMDANFSDYCEIIRYVLKSVKSLKPVVFVNYAYAYLNKAYDNYENLSPKAQEKMAKAMYDLCVYIITKYRVSLPENIQAWCKKYLKNQSIFENIKFIGQSLWTRWVISGYALNLFSIHLKPKFSIKILGVSISKNKTLKTIDAEYKKAFHKMISGKIKDLPKVDISSIFNQDITMSKNKLTVNMADLWNRKIYCWEDGNYISQSVIIWGYGDWKPQTNMVAYAVRHKIPIIFAEDGFLRSADTWTNNSIQDKYKQGVSFTFSNDFLYFDATHPSYLERALNDNTLVVSDEQLNRAKKCIQFIVDNYLTKYNHQPIYRPEIGSPNRKKVLVVDQSYGDLSITKGLANNNTFKKMLKRAIKENPDSDIIIKTHPDTLATGSSRKLGYYSNYNAKGHIYKLTEPINPIALIQCCDKVYVCSSQFGFEALMCGKEVHTFGMPFYAGWGLTIDEQKCKRRTHTRTLEEVFYIAYIMYSHYVNPKEQKRCEIEEAMNYLLELREEYFKEFQVRKDML